MTTNLERAKNIEENVINWRRYLHQIPEIGLDLPETTDYICKVLDEIGVEYERGVGTPSAVVAKIVGDIPSDKVIALRADTDALKVNEETGLEFAAKNGNMHACGHDAHAAMMLGVVKVIKELKSELKGTVKFLFQPAEEISAGAQPMIEAGVLEDVDFIVGLHVGNIVPGLENGKLMISHGPMMACFDEFSIDVKGYGSHGAYPQKSIDPVVISSYIVTAIQEIVSREIAPTDPAVITVGKLISGHTFNVIPETAQIVGTARAVTEDVRQVIAKRIGEIAENIAKAFRATVKYDYIFGAPPLVNSSEISSIVERSAEKIFGDDIVIMNKPVMGGEDFAYYLQKVPGAYVFLSNPLPIEGEIYPHHNPKFALDESQFHKGVALLVQLVEDYLK